MISASHKVSIRNLELIINNSLFLNSVLSSQSVKCIAMLDGKWVHTRPTLNSPENLNRFHVAMATCPCIRL